MRIKGIPFASVPDLLARKQISFERPLHVFFAVCDHYEPMWRGHTAGPGSPQGPMPPQHVQDGRVERWVTEYPEAVAGIRDSAGRPPQHSFFFPGDQYNPRHLDRLAELCRSGYGDVEVHLHHEGDTSQSLRDKLETFVEALHSRHGLLQKDEQGRITYGFIHGDWALDNSRPDGRCCGVNDEITILRETGCYADFTMPSAPGSCQTTTVNSIYYAIDDPERPMSHDRGIPARVGKQFPEDGLLMVQGPLNFDWGSRKWGLLPRVENAELSGRNRAPTIRRFRQWCQAGVCVAGREDWIFIKTYTHGAQEHTTDMFLGDPMRRFHESLADLARSHPALKYYYVTAREMAGLVRQAENDAVIPDVTSPAMTPRVSRRAVLAENTEN